MNLTNSKKLNKYQLLQINARAMESVVPWTELGDQFEKLAADVAGIINIVDRRRSSLSL